MEQPIVWHKDEDGVAEIVLNRPEAMNALNYALLRALEEAVRDIAGDRGVRVVIVRGEGKGFCAGADLKERRGLGPDEVRRNVRLTREVFDRVARLPQPTIAVLHGFAFGGGLELALACDFRVGCRDLRLGLTETSLAIVPGAGGTQRLARIIGPTWAKWMIFTAARIDAERAKELGILMEVADTLEGAVEWARSLAAAIGANGPVAVRQAKWAIDRGLDVDVSTGLAIEDAAYEGVMPTADRLEALAAFAEKRKPQFRGE
ncbi:enoyl-CoA hydratase-related protein [Alicyclobacillus vulcanalis]|uniref:Enoyl-CoA hydratase/carnithine racemase n=1 Tax=Alicyclobacillus vulcanalis TaxID=252246 RepID=A0A1N7L1D4_9BACL|nr:enoyl-CoA hydratase-related protein [Alicyclobacillus vulcanalis]SIS67672.1 Enoyl-CoA hydratase/carnithine racemase [Alicyclobacillus vulcanalis]